MKLPIGETSLTFAQLAVHCDNAAGDSDSWQVESCACASLMLADLQQVGANMSILLSCFSLAHMPYEGYSSGLNWLFVCRSFIPVC